MSTGNPASDSARPCPAQHPGTAESCRFAYGHHGTLHRSAPGREWRQAVSVDFAAPSPSVAAPPVEAATLDLEVVRDARRRMRAALVAVSGRLDMPYPDLPDQSPWSRFIAPALAGLEVACSSLVAEVERLRALVPSSPAGDGLTESIHHAEPTRTPVVLEAATLDLEEALRRYCQAYAEVGFIADGTRKWTMHIPAEPERDSDLVIAAALDRIPDLVAEVERLRAALSHVREETAAATEFGVRWPADEFDDQPEILDDWYSSREMAEEWMRERDAGELIRRPVGATEVVTDADV